MNACNTSPVTKTQREEIEGKIKRYKNLSRVTGFIFLASLIFSIWGKMDELVWVAIAVSLLTGLLFLANLKKLAKWAIELNQLNYEVAIAAFRAMEAHKNSERFQLEEMRDPENMVSFPDWDAAQNVGKWKVGESLGKALGATIYATIEKAEKGCYEYWGLIDKKRKMDEGEIRVGSMLYRLNKKD